MRSSIVVAELDLLSWLRARCAEFEFDLLGVVRRNAEHDWPFVAANPADFASQLELTGHLLPLPKESAALANVLEVAIVNHLMMAAEGEADLDGTRGTERGYPDLELTGGCLGGQFHAVDVKVARRADTKKADRTQSRISLYTGNTYFRVPTLHWPGTFRPFGDYASHLDVLMIYTLDESSLARVKDLELIVQPAWMIASTQRSSTTREYIGAVDLIEDLRAGRGEFETPEAFYAFWRKFPFKISNQVQKQQAKLIDTQARRIEKLEALRKDMTS